MMNPYYVNIQVPIEGTSAKNNIKNVFDFETLPDMYEKTNDENIPIIYNLLYKYYKGMNRTMVTVSMDPSISSSTVAGVNERYSFPVENNGTIQYKSSLKILYINSSPDLKQIDFDNPSMASFQNAIMANLMCLHNKTITKHNVVIRPEQVSYFGLNENKLDDDDTEMLNFLGMEYFSLQTIRKKGIKNVIDYITNQYNDDPVYIVMNISALHKSIAPCSIANITDNNKVDGFNMDELLMILNELVNHKLNIVAIDVTGFDLRIGNKEIAHRITCETVRRVFTKLLNIKEKSINIFNEDSRFLIWRYSDMMDENDVGWYILRNVPMEIKNNLIATIEPDVIQNISLNIDGKDEDILITTTTINEQHERSYFLVDSITDYALFPGEKIDMMFELIN